LTLNDNASVNALIEGYDNQAKAIKEETLRLCWYMRGGITYNEAMMLSTKEREIIGSIIKENIETTKNSGLPFF
jgi:hypothetical protein